MRFSRFFLLILFMVLNGTVQSAVVKNLTTGQVFTDLQVALNALPSVFTSHQVIEVQDTSTYYCTPNVGLVFPAVNTNGFTLTVQAMAGIRPKIDGNGGNICVIMPRQRNVVFRGFELCNISKTDIAGAMLRINDSSYNVRVVNTVFYSGFTAARITLYTNGITLDSCQVYDVRFGAFRVDNFYNLTIKHCNLNMFQPDSTSAGACRIVGGTGFHFEDNDVYAAYNSTELLSMILVNEMQVRRNRFHNGSGSGIYLRGVESATGSPMNQCYDLEISDNLFYELDVAGINFSTVKNVRIFNNSFILKTDASAIFIFKESEDITIRNNLFVDRYTLSNPPPRALMDVRSLLPLTVNTFQSDYNLYDPKGFRPLMHEEIGGQVANYYDLISIQNGRQFRDQHSIDTISMINEGLNPAEPYYMLQAGSPGVNAGYWPDSRFTDNRDYTKMNATTDIGCYNRNSVPNTSINPPVAAFGAIGSRIATTGGIVSTIMLGDSSTNGVTSRFWSFDPPGGVFVNGTNASSAFPQVQFPNYGDYSVKLIVYNGSGSDTLTKSLYIKVNLAYCASSSQSSTGLSLDTVQVQNTRFGKPTSVCVSYQNHILDTVSVEKALPFDLSLRMGSCNGAFSTGYVVMYADFDRNGFFDESTERIRTDTVSQAGTKKYTLLFPASLPTGPMMLRILFFSGVNPSNAVACGPYPEGSTFDINLNVINPTHAIFQPLGPFCVSDGPYVLKEGFPVGGVYTGPGILGSTFNPANVGAGTYTLTYTALYNNLVWVATTTVTVSGRPTVNLPVFPAFCSKDPIVTFNQGTPAGGTYYLNGQPANSFNPATGNTTYVLTYVYTTPSGCSASDTTYLTVNPSPQISLPSISPVCQSGQAFQISGANPGGGVFSGNGVSATGLFSPSSAGAGLNKIRYAVTNSFGCSAIDSLTIQVIANPTASLVLPPSFCADAPAFVLSGGQPAGGVYRLGSNSVSLFNPSQNPPGQYVFSYTVSDAFNCIGIAYDTVVVNPVPQVGLIVADTLCLNGQPYSLIGGVPAGGVYSGNGVSQGQFSPSQAGVGTHYIVYQYTDANGCSKSTSKPIQVIAAPPVTISPIQPICLRGSAVSLNQGNPAGGVFSGNFISNNQFNPALSGVGNFLIQYSYTSPNGCVGVASGTLSVVDTPSISWPNYPPLCGSAAPISLNQAQPNGGAYFFNGQVITSFNPALVSAGTYALLYSVSSVPGCVGYSRQTITVKQTPARPLITRSSDSLISSYPNGNQWLLNGNAIPFATDQVYEPGQNGFYSVKSTDGTCYSLPSQSYVFFFTGIAEKQNAVKVYPIPAIDFIRVDWPFETGQAELISMSGTVVKINSLQKGVVEMGLTDIAEGIYSLILRHQGSVEKVKIAVSR